MKTQIATKKKCLFSYSENLAWYLLAYAQFDKNFKQYLEERLGDTPRPTKQQKIELVHSPWLMPQDFFTAQTRLNWIIKRRGSLAEAEKAFAVLANATTPLSNEILKPLIIGIVGMAIIGPTLGILNKKKNLTLLVDKKFLKNKTQLISKAVQTSHNLTSTALKKAKGDARNIEPDLADWIFGENDISLYASAQHDIHKVEKELESTKVNFSALTDGENIDMLAISPAVDISYLNKSWEKMEL